MNFYGQDHSLLGISFSDLFVENLDHSSPDSPSGLEPSTSADELTTNTGDRNSSPPKHRHDGSSPLPLGMDWSPAPRKLDGRGSVWPFDPRRGWSYCVTVPSWTILPDSSGSSPIVFYRVQVGVQSPEAITTIHGMLRRFSDFLRLFSQLKALFPDKGLPLAPPRKLLRNKSRTFLEERRCSLEDWMEKLLSDIDVSRSAPVADFLELEVAARSSFNDTSASTATSSYNYQSSLDISRKAVTSSVMSDYGDDALYEGSEYGTPRKGVNSVPNLSRADSVSDIDIAATPESSNAQINRTSSNTMRELLENIQRISVEQMHRKRAIMGKEKEKITEGPTSLLYEGDLKDAISEVEKHKNVGHVRTLSADSAWSDTSSARTSEVSKIGAANVWNTNKVVNFYDDGDSLDATDMSSSLQLPRELLVVLPLEARRKFNRVLSTMERRLTTAKTDMEDLVARLNQELAVRQYLSTKVKDLEGELDTVKESSKENLRQAVLTERERFNQMQWDMEELRKSCLEMEVKLKEEQDEKMRVESSRQSIIQDNENLLEELDALRLQLEHSQKHHEQVEQKSKADMKVLIKEVRSLRTSQSELKKELSRLMKEKIELERKLEKERLRREHAATANAKLLHECEILGNRLQECSVNFLVEEEDKLIMDTSSPSDAIDLLNTSDNRIGLLLAEAQLLAQDVETSLAKAASGQYIIDREEGEKLKDDELRKMLTDTFIDNARLRKQINSVIRCTLNTHEKSEEDDVEEEGGFPFGKNVLSKFWRDDDKL